MTLAVFDEETIVSQIYIVRGKRVMLDKDLADLYQAKPKALRQQVKRNIERFPGDFMFQLTKAEAESMVSQNVTPSMQYFGGTMPYAFSEQGVAMLSSVLKSKRAIQVNLQIIRTFVKLRELLNNHKDLRDNIDRIERKYDQQFKVVFEAIRHMFEVDDTKKQFGFVKIEEGPTEN
ncbi:ORF6N domain-containing protein [bacterium]|jgi:hypothetical protein|nr:ORF6N domain-containing protein [bacterium]